jgi:hypothetical protein
MSALRRIPNLPGPAAIAAVGIEKRRHHAGHGTRGFGAGHGVVVSHWKFDEKAIGDRANPSTTAPNSAEGTKRKFIRHVDFQGVGYRLFIDVIALSNIFASDWDPANVFDGMNFGLKNNLADRADLGQLHRQRTEIGGIKLHCLALRFEAEGVLGRQRHGRFFRIPLQLFDGPIQKQTELMAVFDRRVGNWREEFSDVVQKGLDLLLFLLGPLNSFVAGASGIDQLPALGQPRSSSISFRLHVGIQIEKERPTIPRRPIPVTTQNRFFFSQAMLEFDRAFELQGNFKRKGVRRIDVVFIFPVN